MTDGPERGPSPDRQLAEAVRMADARADRSSVEERTAPHVIIRVGNRWFAAPALCVKEVVTKGAVTWVPYAPQDVVGVALIHERLIPVVELPGETVHARAAVGKETLPRLVVLAGPDAEIAVVADEVRGPIPLAPRAAGGEADSAHPFIDAEAEWRGVAVGVLDLARLVTTVLGAAP